MLEFSLNGKKYSISSDLHTHTMYSHGTGSIEDNVMAARLRNLKRIGISDHGFGHATYGMKRSDVPKMRAEIEKLKKKYNDIEILMGIEANISNTSGLLDVRPEEFDEFDYVIAGIHYGALGINKITGMSRSMSNLVNSHIKSEPGRKAIKRNTALVIKAIERNPIAFLVHPGENAPIDLLEVALACANTGTLIEINTGHLTITADDIKTMALADVKFIINSDAHSPAHVGDFVASVQVALEAGLDLSRIVNLEVY